MALVRTTYVRMWGGEPRSREPIRLRGGGPNACTGVHLHGPQREMSYVNGRAVGISQRLTRLEWMGRLNGEVL